MGDTEATRVWLLPSVPCVVTLQAQRGCPLRAEAGAKAGSGAETLREPVASLPGRKHRVCCLRREERGQPYWAEGKAGARGPWWIPRATTRPPPHCPHAVLSGSSPPRPVSTKGWRRLGSVCVF